MNSEEILDLKVMKDRLTKFARERDWEQFHTPKNLAMALGVEAAELMEIFQWMNDQKNNELVNNKNNETINKISDEIADILVYVIRLATILDINLPNAIDNKLIKNAKKYPVDLVKGSSKKYTEYK